ncbi:MAG: SPOR domain-containing protein [Alphaproteobacteria bacterium]|nr:SPOR domain-containing protein [Alphaproteobacteria bacterium]
MYQDFFNKNDGYLDEFKQKVAEQKIATMAERRSDLARSRNNFLGSFAGIALAGVVAWFVLMPQYQQTFKEIPVIRRPQAAVKVKPENPGGMEIPNQDKEVYAIVEKKNVDNTVVENLLPTPEQPKLPDIVPETLEVDANAENLDELVEEVEEEEGKNTQAVAKAEEQTSEKASAVPEKPEDILKSDEKGAVEEKVVKAEEKQPETKEAESPTAAPQVKEEAPKGNWQIQLIASKNKDAIEKTWQTLASKYSLLKAYNHEIQSADLGSQGMIYKLRAGAFTDKAAAQAVCAKLKQQGLNDCIVKER